MKPDAVNLSCIRTAIDAVRERDTPHEVDDEHLASLIEHGIGAVPLDQRATLLRAIGNSPQIATIVAELAPSASAEAADSPMHAVFGIRARTWLAAWAACALLAVSVTAWHLMAPNSSAGAPISLLDGGVEGPSHDFADGLQESLRRKTAIMLWALLAILTAPTVLTMRRSVSPMAADRRSPHGAP